MRSPLQFAFPNFKRRGEWAELVFMARAAALGCTVLKPFGDSSRYDVVVDHRGRLVRVQVKSASVRKDGRITVQFVTTRSTRYKASDVDYLAVYVLPADTWYIIPIRAVAGCDYIRFHPNEVTNSTRFEKYRECWHLLLKARWIRGRSPRSGEWALRHRNRTRKNKR